MIGKWRHRDIYSTLCKFEVYICRNLTKLNLLYSWSKSSEAMFTFCETRSKQQVLRHQGGESVETIKRKKLDLLAFLYCETL